MTTRIFYQSLILIRNKRLELWEQQLAKLTSRFYDRFPIRFGKQIVKQFRRGEHYMNEIKYIQVGDQLLPDLKLTDQEDTPLGKYGRMRKAYLKEHRPINYNRMVLDETLFPHLREIDQTARERLEQMMPQLAKEAGATEQLKASDPMKWVGLMHTCKAQAEEILKAELIFV